MPAPLDPALLDRLPTELRGAVAAAVEARLSERDAALDAERTARRRAEERVGPKARVPHDARLEHLIRELRRARFGRSSEKLGEDQLELAFEDIETAIAEEREARGSDEPRAPSSSRAARRRARVLPKGLPREERVIAPADLRCPCGCGDMVAIGEDRAERLDVTPAHFRVLVTVRPRHACPKGRAGVRQAPAPPALIEGGLPTEATIAHVVVSKCADPLPMYRQAQIMARQGVTVDRATLSDWAGRAAFHLAPVVDRMAEHPKAGPRRFMDETTAPVLDPGRGRTKTGCLWAVMRDDRPSHRRGASGATGGSDPPGVVFHHAPGRGGEQVASELVV